MPLYVVATPIGNLTDISQRAIEALSAAEVILAEDTSHSIRLLKAHRITTPLKRFDAYEEKQLNRNTRLCSLIKKDATIALISDAGSPLISDPGKLLVQFCHNNHIRVVPIPGPCAAISALSISGFDANSFIFGGYLPRQPTLRRAYLNKHRSVPSTSVFYETPQRIGKSCDDLCSIWGSERKALLARELTKINEQVVSATLGDINQLVHSQEIKGEIVLVVEGKQERQKQQEQEDDWNDEDERTLKLLLKELSVKRAVKTAAALREKSKNLFYHQALKIQQEP